MSDKSSVRLCLPFLLVISGCHTSLHWCAQHVFHSEFVNGILLQWYNLIKHVSFNCCHVIVVLKCWLGVGLGSGRIVFYSYLYRVVIVEVFVILRWTMLFFFIYFIVCFIKLFIITAGFVVILYCVAHWSHNYKFFPLLLFSSSWSQSHKCKGRIVVLSGFVI